MDSGGAIGAWAPPVVRLSHQQNKFINLKLQIICVIFKNKNNIIGAFRRRRLCLIRR
jgi:hypothetical protein